MRRRKATVELFEQIRREYEFGLGTIQGVARKFGVHRRLVREAVQSAVPRQKAPAMRPRPRLEPVAAFVDAILDADRQAPRKQRHTAHRIYERLRQEHAEHPIAESTVRRYVREQKAMLGLLKRETFVPQSYAWGSEAQVDWYEAYADLGDERVKLQVFALRSMASSGSESLGSPSQTSRNARVTRSPSSCSGPPNDCAIRSRALGAIDITGRTADRRFSTGFSVNGTQPVTGNMFSLIANT